MDMVQMAGVFTIQLEHRLNCAHFLALVGALQDEVSFVAALQV